ncbi:hypothetical protein GC207_15685 [bacterium]|nr:hypothetical protein [bacterium]
MKLDCHASHLGIMRRIFPRLFLGSALVLLAFTGTAKLISAAGATRILGEADPVVGIPTRLLLLFAGSVEMATVIAILKVHSTSFRSLLVAILGAEFLLYRAVFEIGQYSRGCPCLGSFTAWSHLPDSLINGILWAVAVWLCLGGLLSFSVSLMRERTNHNSELDERTLSSIS